MIQLIYPPSDTPVGNPQVVFLAGPIQGAPDWQNDAFSLLVKATGEPADLCIANPRTPSEKPWHGDYNGQVDWELEYLERAARTGAIVFWLALPDPSTFVEQAEADCTGAKAGKVPRAYAQTSRFELGEWVGRTLMSEKVPFSLGIEPGFTNERYIRRRISNLRDQEIPDNLERTVELAVERLRSL